MREEYEYDSFDLYIGEDEEYFEAKEEEEALGL